MHNTTKPQQAIRSLTMNKAPTTTKLTENPINTNQVIEYTGVNDLFTSMDNAAALKAKQFQELNDTIEQFKKQQAKHLNNLKELEALLFGGNND